MKAILIFFLTVVISALKNPGFWETVIQIFGKMRRLSVFLIVDRPCPRFLVEQNRSVKVTNNLTLCITYYFPCSNFIQLRKGSKKIDVKRFGVYFTFLLVRLASFLDVRVTISSWQ